MKLFPLLIFLGIFLLPNAQISFAQNEDKFKKNTVSLELGIESYYTHIRIVHDRDLLYQRTGYDSEIMFSLISGLGINPVEGNDTVREGQFLTFGINSGARFFDIHRFEVGLQYLLRRSREGYGGISKNDEWTYRSSIRSRVGYRFEGKTYTFKIFMHPAIEKRERRIGLTDNLKTENLIILNPGLGLGIKF